MKQPFFYSAILAGATLTCGDARAATPIIDASLLLWLDASNSSSVVMSGADVTQWQDQSGNGFHAIPTANAPGFEAASSINGQPAIRFTAGDGMVLPDGLNVTRPYTAFIVDSYWGAAHGRTLQSRDLNWLMGKWGNRDAHFAEGWVSLLDDGSHSVAIGEALGSATGSEYYVNGNSADGTNSLAAGPTAAPGRLGIAAGGAFSGEVSDADIAEILIYDRVLSSAEREQVRTYLGEKYGITVFNGNTAAVSTYSGADPGEGLDLNGIFSYAVNVGGGDAGLAGAADFTSQGTLGVSIDAANTIGAWGGAPNLGGSAADDVLEAATHSIRWDVGSTPPLTVDLDGLIPGAPYELQLLFHEPGVNPNRVFDVFVEGELVYDQFSSALGQTDANNGAVLTYNFVATDTMLNIALSGLY
ncbi:MAG: hypothetical protein R3F11_11960, partial [Verrucomicrobiales bacterium]